jgi:hypothetical protein
VTEMSKGKLKNLIPDIFSDTIVANNFLVLDQSKHSEHINLSNDNYTIRFIDDLGLIEVSFVDPREKIKAENTKRDDGLPTPYLFYPVFAKQ